LLTLQSQETHRLLYARIIRMAEVVEYDEGAVPESWSPRLYFA
jgi:hypothetical protein